ncbi:MAG: hypothetical protein M4579_006261 [Chaenotheca gracillima]|nr:MAG: hypothetical protein M4579_006261 [Chaenotheca gracillima]
MASHEAREDRLIDWEVEEGASSGQTDVARLSGFDAEADSTAGGLPPALIPEPAVPMAVKRSNDPSTPPPQPDWAEVIRPKYNYIRFFPDEEPSRHLPPPASPSPKSTWKVASASEEDSSRSQTAVAKPLEALQTVSQSIQTPVSPRACLPSRMPVHSSPPSAHSPGLSKSLTAASAPSPASATSHSLIRLPRPLQNGDQSLENLTTSQITSRIPPGRIYQPAEQQLFPPAIIIQNLPNRITVSGFLSMIRVHHGRIRLVRLGTAPNDRKLYFMFWSAHKAFLKRAHEGRIVNPWRADLKFTEGDLLPAVLDEQQPDVTRVLCIESRPGQKLVIGDILADLLKVGRGRLWAIEKVRIVTGDRGPTSRMASVYFTTVRESVAASRMIQAENETILEDRYRANDFWFGKDECSSSGPQFGIREDLLQLRTAQPTNGGRDEIGLISLGYKVHIDDSMPALPMPAIAGKPSHMFDIVHLPLLTPEAPLPYPPWGIVIDRLPLESTTNLILSSIGGGRVLQAYLFTHDGKRGRGPGYKSATVFFTTQEEQQLVLTHISKRGGLLLRRRKRYLSGARYKVSPFEHTEQPPAYNDKVWPAHLSRCISITLDDIPENRNCTATSFTNWIYSRATVRTEVVHSSQSVKLRQKTVLLQLAGIPSAVEAMSELDCVTYAGGPVSFTYAYDPCTQPVHGMI